MGYSQTKLLQLPLQLFLRSLSTTFVLALCVACPHRTFALVEFAFTGNLQNYTIQTSGFYIFKAGGAQGAPL